MAWAAYVFAVAAIGGSLFQLALAAGAPWGEFAMGGRYPGRFPPPMRVAAVIQAVALAALGWIILARAEVVEAPGWGRLGWLAVGVSALSLIMNAASRSKRERALWTPIAAVMLVTSLLVVLG